MSELSGSRPTICLNMIVRNEAHIVREVLDAAAGYISSWVIVDTGSDDGTQDVIRAHMGALGIAGELHDRPWRNFGENRSEALALAQGHGDYIWVMDADDTIVGAPDFSGLDSDVYAMRINDGLTYWRRQLFRDGLPWRYVGVVHEYADCDVPFVERRLGGDYYIKSRRLGARNADPLKYARDRDLLLGEVDRNPDDERSVFYLAESYFNLGDFANARLWASRRAGMGGWAEEVFYAKFQVAQSMSRLGEPWPAVLDAYLQAWEFRPTRAEPLHALAARCRSEQRYQLGHVFAKRAADITLPDDDILFVNTDVYTWRALDEQAICASWIGHFQEAFTLCRRILARPDISDDDRRRIAENRDITVPAMIEAASSYPDALADSLVKGQRDAEVTVSLVAGPDRDAAEQALNSFLQCCLDIARVGRFVVLDAGLSAQDLAILQDRYRFLEFIGRTSSDETLAQLTQILPQIGGRYWLHLGLHWRFFAPDALIARLTGVLDTESEVAQVGINVDGAHTLSGHCAPESVVRRDKDGGRYVLTAAAAEGPAMFDTARLAAAPAVEPGTATLDEVLCVQRV